MEEVKDIPQEQVYPQQGQTEKSLTENLPPFEAEPNYKKSIIIVFIVIILISTVILWLLFLRKKPDNNKPPATTPTPVTESKITITPAHKIGLGEDWNLFESQYGYTLNYPAKWQLHRENWQEGNKTYSLADDDEAIIRFVEPDQPDHSGNPYGITVSLKKPLANPDNLSVRNWLKMNLPLLGFITTQDITINNIKSAKVKALIGGNLSNVFIPFKGKVYKITSQPYTIKDSPLKDYQNLYDYENAFAQILTTIEFTGKNKCASCPLYAPPPPGWCNNGQVTPGEDIYDKEKDCYCQGPSKCVK